MDNDDMMLNIARPTRSKDAANEGQKAEKTDNRKLKYSVKFRKENARRGRREREFDYNLLPNKDENKKERPVKENEEKDGEGKEVKRERYPSYEKGESYSQPKGYKKVKQD